MIAACSSDGRVWFSVNRGYTNSVTFYGFLLAMCHQLEQTVPEWRQHVIFYLDNAMYHKSEYVKSKAMRFQIPIFYSGPYSFDAAPCEKLFAIIKRHDLNPLSKSFNSRIGQSTYI